MISVIKFIVLDKRENGLFIGTIKEPQYNKNIYIKEDFYFIIDKKMTSNYFVDSTLPEIIIGIAEGLGYSFSQFHKD